MVKSKVTKKVVTPAEFREAKKAAKTLNMDVQQIEFFDCWTAKDNDTPCWPKNPSKVEDGRIYFNVEMDGEMHKIYSDDEDAYALVHFL